MISYDPTLFNRDFSPVADCRPPAFADEGSVKHSGESYPPYFYVRVSSSYHGKVVLKITAVLRKTVRLFILHKLPFCVKTILMNTIQYNKKNNAKKYTQLFYGAVCGFLNGLFGSGGGTVAVPAFEKNGIESKKAHASSVALIFVLSIVTAVVYLINGKLDFGAAWEYIPYGLAGAILGSLLLGKMPDRLLRTIFGLLIIASAVRMMI